MTFQLIIQLSILSSFFVVGIYMNRDKGDIFYFLQWLTAGVPEWVQKPVIGCVNCMASFWTLVVMGIYHFLVGLPEMFWYRYFLLWLVVAIICSGLNGILWMVYRWLRAYAEALENNYEDTKIE